MDIHALAVLYYVVGLIHSIYGVYEINKQSRERKKLAESLDRQGKFIDRTRVIK
jgi:hypothetical protein